MNIPDRKECLRLLKENHVPENILAHSIKVAEVALKYGRMINNRGGNVNLRLLEAGALLHDISKHESLNNPKVDHGRAGAVFLRKLGYPEIADIVELHAMHTITNRESLNTWEKKLVFYADKRVTHDKIVSFKERMIYLIKTYSHLAEKLKMEEPLVIELEKEIFTVSGAKE